MHVITFEHCVRRILLIRTHPLNGAPKSLHILKQLHSDTRACFFSDIRAVTRDGATISEVVSVLKVDFDPLFR